MPFSKRLEHLKGDSGHSAFAQKIGISEALLRKYLNGSDPSLSKAAQIAKQTQCSLEWLGGESDTPFPKETTLSLSLLEGAVRLVGEVNEEQALNLNPKDIAKLVSTTYQYIKNVTRDNPKVLNVMETKQFIHHLTETYTE